MNRKPQAASAARPSADNQARLPTLTVSLVGVGAMGSALGRGWLRQGVLAPAQLTFFDPSDATSKAFEKATGCKRVRSLNWALGAKVVVFCVKPQDLPGILREAGFKPEDASLWVSVAAGISLATLEEASGRQSWARVMPNLACALGRGTMGMCFGEGPADLKAEARQLFEPLGTLVEVKESQMHAVTALAGSGPAFVLAALEGMADGGVLTGLPYAQALQLAVGAMDGAVALMAEENHPSPLKNKVTSPAGTTIAGLLALEEDAFRAALMRAVKAAAERSKELSSS